MYGENKPECLRGIIHGINNIYDTVNIGNEILLTDIEKFVLNKNQISLIPFLNEFNNDFFLVGGTAVALHLGHRKSIDFDMFSFDKVLKPSEILQKLEKNNLLKYLDEENYKDLKHSALLGGDEARTEYILYIKSVQVQFVYINIVIYEGSGYNFNKNHVFFNTIKSLDINQLLGMKMFALMNRNKWKDIVDLYIILNKTGISLIEAFNIAEHMYGNIFNRKYVIDRILENHWNKTEGIEFLGEYKKYNNISENEILTYLVKYI